jgi:hypothetical protein
MSNPSSVPGTPGSISSNVPGNLSTESLNNEQNISVDTNDGID